MELKYDATQGRFIAACSYWETIKVEGIDDALRASIPAGVLADGSVPAREVAKAAGFYWKPDEKIWWSADVPKALLLFEYADPECFQYLTQYVEEATTKHRIVIRFLKGRYVAECASAEGEQICIKAGFRRLDKSGIIRTRDAWVAYRLSAYADEECRTQLQEWYRRTRRMLQLSRAKTSDLEFPVPEGLAYYDFQKAGIAYALEAISERGGVLLGDDMGIGKTVQGIGLINCRPEYKRILIICPAGLKSVWRNHCAGNAELEMKPWLVRDYKVDVIYSDKAWPQPAGLLQHGQIIIINYEILYKFIDLLKAFKPDLVIADESHRLRNHETRQSTAVAEVLTEGRPHRCFTTGTMVCNKPMDAFEVMRHVDPLLFPNRSEFAAVYAQGRMTDNGYKADGAANLDQLQERMRGTCFIRRLKAEVLKDLPPKTRQIIPLPSTPATMAAEQAFFGDNPVAREDLKWYLESLFNDPNATQGYDPAQLEAMAPTEDFREWGEDAKRLSVSRETKSRMKNIAYITKLLHATALAKVPDVIKIVKEAIETSSSKVLLFAHHKDVIEQYREAFADHCVHIIGGMPAAQREEAERRFQKDDRVRLFIGSITACGEGLTLTAGSLVLFAELNWLPSVMSQAEDRAYRIGTSLPVNVQHIVLDGSIDAYIAAVLVRKQDIIDRTLDRKLKAEEHPEAETLTRLVDPRVLNMRTGLRVLLALADADLLEWGFGMGSDDCDRARDLLELDDPGVIDVDAMRIMLQKYQKQLPANLYRQIFVQAVAGARA